MKLVTPTRFRHSSHVASMPNLPSGVTSAEFETEEGEQKLWPGRVARRRAPATMISLFTAVLFSSACSSGLPMLSRPSGLHTPPVGSSGEGRARAWPPEQASQTGQTGQAAAPGRCCVHSEAEAPRMTPATTASRTPDNPPPPLLRLNNGPPLSMLSDRGARGAYS